MARPENSGTISTIKFGVVSLVDVYGQVRVNWLSYALTNGIGEQTRARVFLRQRLGREPAKAEVDDYGKDGSAQAEVTPAQMLEAFRSGAEVISFSPFCSSFDDALRSAIGHMGNEVRRL